MFTKVLRALETGGISYSDVLARTRRLLASGASAKEFLAVLKRRSSIEPLPEYAQMEALLLEAVGRDAEQNPDPPPAPAAESAAPASTAAEGSTSVPPAASPDVSMPYPSSESATLEALTRSYEEAREAEWAAAEQANRLTADLEAVRSALRAEQSRVRDIERTLAERDVMLDRFRQALDERDARIASLVSEKSGLQNAIEAATGAVTALETELHAVRARAEAATERADTLAADLEAVRSALRAEQSKVRDIERTLAERNVTLDRSQRALGERDARIASLVSEKSSLQNAIEAATGSVTALETELRAVRARAEAAGSELRTAREEAAALDAELKRSAARLKSVESRAAAVPPPAPHPQMHTDPQTEPPPSPSPQPRPRPKAPSPLLHRGVPWSDAPLRAVGWGAAAVLIVVFIWLLVHRSPPPPPAAAASAALPAPGTVIRDCPDCPEMTVLPAGRFKQGSVGGSAFGQPLHWVLIGHPIAMSTNPVTLEDFGQFAAATGRDMQGCDTYDGEWKQRPGDSWERPGFAQTGTHPVTCVSWNDAEAYAKWLSAKTGHRYRLPSASEWEYAARAGNEAPQPWRADGQDACADANVADASAAHHYPGWAVFPCDDGYVYTAPVGTFKANSFGLNDMLGNVLQWTEDCWYANYLGAPIDGSARRDGDCSLHEIRGGSWFSNPSYVRADYRDHFPADYRTSSVGIRLVRDI
jgi:formylglycine-generating enzyme required for sulfatase activity